MLAEVASEQGMASALMLGRRTYEVFADSWPHQDDEVPLARHINAMEKIVVTSTLKSPSWNNSRTIGFPQLSALKENGEGHITVAGSISLVESLIAAGMLDELRILTHPVILGRGRRLFDTYGGGRAELELNDSRTLERGVILSIYQPSMKHE